MTALRPVAIIMTPEEENEAPGVTIRRTIGSGKLVLLDPFLLLDHLTVPAEGNVGREVGFPRHPHRGIETLTYVIAGDMHHTDSTGNDDGISTGESQWMTAGGGIFHSEMARVGASGHESLQIWTNLPAAEKMKAPGYRAARNAEIPEIAVDAATVRVVSGTVNGTAGPIQGIAVGLTYLDVHLPAGATVTLPAPPGETTYAYLYRGTATFGADKRQTEAPNLVIFADGNGVQATAGATEARFMLASARPLREPVLQYRSLVMNTVEEMKQALDDLDQGTFAR
jgi:redox-sensitive bicupin YhaK (pirin superfamily)